MNEGWVCPKCKKVWAPSVKSCECPTSESTETPKPQLLTEGFAVAEMMVDAFIENKQRIR